ncbi:TRAP transporter large permease [Methylobacterium sp. SyP6R]|uniref:TRAP transporter large permease n=1 Tax=Methylobacterium sp. SyP6R TaxID=2718876 RepID=UPI001F02546D|nr:TRAP transporter large permease subunit [Methylobacterium sp. SyP6R]MCF4129489.1 TRAP transporter large permease subunit [Methylobacterium sp. SyP6R]
MVVETGAAALPARASLPAAIVASLLRAVQALAALALLADLGVVAAAVLWRFATGDSLEWADEVARMLLIVVAFLGGAAAVAHGRHVGIRILRDAVPPAVGAVMEAAGLLVELGVVLALAACALSYAATAATQVTPFGLPQNLFIYPLVVGGACMAVFIAARLADLRGRDVGMAALALAGLAGLVAGWTILLPDAAPSPLALLLLAFAVALGSGIPIAFALSVGALVFLVSDGGIDPAVFAQQASSGIDNFVLLAIPFFVLTGLAMEVNGMSVRLIELLRRAIGERRGGLGIVTILAMVLFSGISGSKLADVTAVGTVTVPAMRRSGQDPREGVALLAASAIMAETIPPCINLIILGYVANISIGGLFAAGILPALLMAAALVAGVVVFSARARPAPVERSHHGLRHLLWSSAVSLGVIVIIFGGYRSGFATATEIGAFAVVYAIVVGILCFRELGLRALADLFVRSATLAGMILFVVAASQTIAFSLTINQVPHALAEAMIALSHGGGAWIFLLVSIALLVVMGAALEGAPALIIFGPLLLPVAQGFGIAPLHYGIVLIIAMGLGLFAPPLGLGLYTACAVGGVSLEETVRPIGKYLLLLLACLVLIALVPEITLWLPRSMGFVK